MSDKTQVECVSLKTANEEYLDVERGFHKSVGREKYHIVKIERIQNRTLHEQYSSKKKQIEASFSRGNCEKMLWHGTAHTAVTSIKEKGFDRSYCGKNATVYGQGVYFAKDASYSAQDTYSPLDYSRHKKMFRCLVLTGEYTTGTAEMRHPPPNCHSSCNDIEGPYIFVIFTFLHNSRARDHK
ncbi:hypothetical protein DPMN_046392 [Dreissena polymorpha]|uniref:Poly [ADP-ribose] polymerase n=1 Tax=Dreissena polymorpha TaxID=45954 RepID=A0A9D4D629_DREPO|nr:hypothetical protein DPMN_046392 [Dreissena polymorpha]